MMFAVRMTSGGARYFATEREAVDVGHRH